MIAQMVKASCKILVLSGAMLVTRMTAFAQDTFTSQIFSTLSEPVLMEAQWAVQQQPITVTAETSPRSAGGKNDFFLKETTGGRIQTIPMVHTSSATE